MGISNIDGGDNMVYETGEIVCSNCKSIIKWKKPSEDNIEHEPSAQQLQASKHVPITNEDDEIRCPQCLVYVPLTSKI